MTAAAGDVARPAAPARPENTNLPHGLSLGAAIAAGLFGPALLSNSAAWLPTLWPALVLTAGAALLALHGRLPAPRSVRAWTLWAVGSTLLLLLALFGMGLGAVGILAQQGALLAGLTMLAWVVAILLTALEAKRAFGVARVMHGARHVLYALCAPVLIALAGLRIGDLALDPVRRALLGTVWEGLAPALTWTGVALCALAAATIAWQLARWLARRQLAGGLAAGACGEAMWFFGLAALLLPFAVPGISAPWDAAAPPIDGSAWGDAALRVLAVVVAYGAVRIALGGAASATPTPLLVLVGPEVPGPALRRMLSQLPGAWHSGPTCRVMVPAAAAQEHGAHLRLAARCDAEALLFPAGIQGLHAWRDALPPIPKWRALPAQELYAEPPLWPDVIDAWITPQTWVLLIDDETDGRTVRPAWTTPRLATALPQQRALRVALTALGHPRQATEPNRGLQQKWPAALHHLALWHSEPAKAPAAAFTAWLRERVHPAASRRIVVLHGRGDAALAEMLASRLDGRTDAKGRFVEAWTSSAEGRFDWGMPLSGLRFMMQVVMHHAMPDESADAQQRLARRIQRFIVHAVFRIPQTQPAAFEVVSLLSGSLRAAVEDWTGGWQSGPVLTAATRRIGVQVDAGAGPIHPLDGQLALPGTHDAEVTALARQLLDEAWVGVAPAARALPGTHDAEVNALARQLLDEAWVGVVPAARAAAGVEAVSTLALPAAVTAMASLGGDGLAAALATGQVMLVSHRGTPTTLPGMPNATCLLALGEGELGMANADGLVGRWRAGTASMQVLGQHRGAVRALAHSDAGWLLSGGDDRILRGWGLAVGDRRETGGFPAAITAIDVEAGRVFIACGEAGVFVMTSVSDTPSQALQVRDASVDVLQVHGDNLYVAGRNATGTGFASRAMLRHEGLPARDLALPAPVSAFVVLADERVALGCEDGSLWMWTPGSEGANRLDELPRQQGAVRALVVDAHGILCSAGIDGIVRRQPR